MKLTDIASAPEVAYRELQRNIDSLPEDKVLILENCEMPPGCVPERTALMLFHDGEDYILKLDDAVLYTGFNRAMQFLCSGKPLPFTNFQMLSRFLRLLPSRPPTPTSPELQPHRSPSSSPVWWQR